MFRYALFDLPLIVTNTRRSIDGALLYNSPRMMMVMLYSYGRFLFEITLSLLCIVAPDEVDYQLVFKRKSSFSFNHYVDRSVIGEIFFPEDLMKCEDYVLWLNILREGYTAKGNNIVLATYNILENNKSRKKLKLIKYMHYVYHKPQEINWFKSWELVFRYLFPMPGTNCKQRIVN